MAEFELVWLFLEALNHRSADNRVPKVDGKTESFRLDIEGNVCEFDFLDHEDNDGHLGLDWFMRKGASFFEAFEKNYFMLEPTRISLCVKNRDTLLDN
ncbi:unnamed protein product, partial [Brachionus calyciflorus]